MDENATQPRGAYDGRPGQAGSSARTDSEGSDTGAKYRASIRVKVSGRQPRMTATSSGRREKILSVPMEEMTTTSSGRREKILSVPMEEIPATCEVCEEGTEYYVSVKTPPREGEGKIGR